MTVCTSLLELHNRSAELVDASLAAFGVFFEKAPRNLVTLAWLISPSEKMTEPRVRTAKKKAWMWLGASAAPRSWRAGCGEG